MMQVQAVNNHARKKYDEMESAMNAVRMAIDELDKFCRSSLNRQSEDRSHGWRVPTKDEVVSGVRKASHDLDVMHKQASKYKSELVSRGWRV